MPFCLPETLAVVQPYVRPENLGRFAKLHGVTHQTKVNFFSPQFEIHILQNKMKVSLKINKFSSFGILPVHMVQIHFGTESINYVRPISKAYYTTEYCLW